MTVTTPLPLLLAAILVSSAALALLVAFVAQLWHDATDTRRIWLDHQVKPTLRWWAHNLVAHPLLVIIPPLGQRLHDATIDIEGGVDAMCRVDYYNDDDVCLHPPAARKARKAHRCHDCGRCIAKGETYTYGFWSDLGAVKMCGHCIEAGRWLVEECGGHLYPGVLEELGEHQAEGYHGLAWLLTAGRMGWTRHGELIPLEQVAAHVDKALARRKVTA